MFRLIKTILILAIVVGVSILSYTYINVQSNSNNGQQSLDIWNQAIDNDGYVDLIGRINDDHMLQEVKTSRLREYLNNNKDLFTSIFTLVKEKKNLPYMYESLITEKKKLLSKYELSKTLKFNKTNNMVKFRVRDKTELKELNSSGVLYEIFQPHIYSVTTGPTANVVSSPAAWSRDSSDVSFPDQGNKQEGNNSIIAILDTGVENYHPYLLNKLKYEACFQDNEDDDDCHNGDTGINAALPCPNKYSQCSHGTMMAGIATGNGKIIKQENNGIARNADIFALQVFSTFTDSRFCGGPNGCARTTEAEYSKLWIWFIYIICFVKYLH